VWTKTAPATGAVYKSTVTPPEQSHNNCDCRPINSLQRTLCKDGMIGTKAVSALRGCIYPQIRSLLILPIVDFVSRDNNNLLHTTLSASIVNYSSAHPATLLRRPEQYLSTPQTECTCTAIYSLVKIYHRLHYKLGWTEATVIWYQGLT